jgi:uncharacterized protein
MVCDEISVELLRELVASGIDPNLEDREGWSALHFAAQSGVAECVEVLLEVGANVDARDKFGNTPLWRAVFNYRGRGTVITRLLLAGSDPHALNRSGVSPASLAQTTANNEVARFFIDVNQRDV